MRQRNGIVGGRFGKRQMPLDLPGKANLPGEGNEAGQPAEDPAAEKI